MLPVIFSGISGSVISANVYGTTGFMADQGFEDTWMIIGGLARALVRGVDVYVLLSAPCSFGANDPDAAGLDGGDMCPIDGSPPSGFNLWSQVVEDHGGFWPSSTEYPSSIPEKRSRARKLGGKDASETSLTRNHRQLTYGYGWTLENTADWIFAYLAIHPEERPQSAHGRAAANELINLICKRAHIAHVRVAASEATYGTRADGTQVRMTQIGNHAKVIMADDSAFYMGSNNAYGAGLAEFGLIVDDAEVATELDNNYYTPLWQQAKAGAISGSDAVGCPWRERLASRDFPVDLEKEDVGEVCLINSACSSGKCDAGFCVNCYRSGDGCNVDNEYCDLGRCKTKLLRGNVCVENRVCQSGICDASFHCVDCYRSGQGCNDRDNEYCDLGQCKTKLSRGNVCVENRVCQSDICDASYHCVDCYRSGDGCNGNEYCDWGQCKTKLGYGYTCAESRVCRNGYCTWWLTCN